MGDGAKFSYLHLGNVGLIEEMRALYLQDPAKVDPSWAYFFEGMDFIGKRTQDKGVATAGAKELAIANLIHHYRRFGYLKANCNPIATHPPTHPKELALELFGFSKEDLKESFPSGGLFEKKEASLEAIIDRLEKIYCQSIGVEYKDRHSPELELWLEHEIEPSLFRPNYSIEKKKAILHSLNRSELFETFLHTKYVGQKRFSLEGGETLIPVLQEIIDKSAELGADEFVIGMAHRGRLNVLTNIMKKSYSMLFSEFEDYYDPSLTQESGDVKYHRGFSSNVMAANGKQIHIGLTANPSHLESVNPVVEGKVRAKQLQRQDFEMKKVVPILIHGDSSIAGQGVVYETLQLSQVQGYATGGTLHIIVNNQIGFTTLPHEYRSGKYSTDIASGFGIPVFHVNAEDPEGCVYATSLACQIRAKFGCDVFIEINCYRKYGHNEGDEPAFTQPLEYQLIRKKSSIREIYRDQLIGKGVLEKQIAIELEEEFKKELHYELEVLQLKKEPSTPEAFDGVWRGYRKAEKGEVFLPIKSGVSLELLQEIGKRFSSIPENFQVNPKLVKWIEQREHIFQKDSSQRLVDWALAEHLAFGTLLWEGHHVRLSGQDCLRGTFTQRHAVWVDQKDGHRYFPLSNLKPDQAACTIYNSPLSEFAVLGFEFGYSLSYPSALVMWEAQFGDFANGAQIIFDQYVVASEKKWRRYSGLVVLLPHGFEGQGSEHSSGRLERFLQLAAEENIQVVYPTTPAQYFHMLRRQVKREIRLPLIVFTPKGLLRHPQCLSALKELETGCFQEVLDDPERKQEAKRLLLCSGRIYYDLMAARAELKREEIAILRVEQLYPFPEELLKERVSAYPQAKEIFWVQEEPHNMGGWSFVAPILQKAFAEKQIHFIGRAAAASPATGSHKVHKKEQDQIIERALR